MKFALIFEESFFFSCQYSLLATMQIIIITSGHDFDCSVMSSVSQCEFYVNVRDEAVTNSTGTIIKSS